MASFGYVTSVVERPVGTTLAVAAAATDDSIVVDDISKLTWPEGGLRIGNEQHTYTINVAPDQTIDVIDKDEDAVGADEIGTITLTSALVAAYGIDEPVVQFQESVVTERVATVLLPDQAEELVLRVPRHLWDRLPSGIRERDAAPETVALANEGGGWVMGDVVAEDPSVDASFINTATLPAATPPEAGAGADLPGLGFTEPWLNPSRVSAPDNSWATATGSSVSTPSVAATTGFKYPRVVADDASVGAQNWTATSAALGAPDDTGTAATAPSGLNTHYLKLTDFGFTVPGGATVTGVSVTVIRRNASFTGFGGGAVQDNLVKLVKAGSVAGTDQSNPVHWPDSFTGISYGGDLWDTTLTPADVNDPDFGVAISADMNAGGEARIDAVRVKVNYTTAAVTARSDTHRLEGSNFGFAGIVPDDARISGITVQVKRHASANSGNNYVTDNMVKLVSPVGDTSSDRATGAHWPTADATVTYGGDLWGLEWGPEDINDPDFAVWVSANVNYGVTASIDYIAVTVHYVADGDA